jgi:hypothetical protein
LCGASDPEKALEYAQDNDEEWLVKTFGSEGAGAPISPPFAQIFQGVQDSDNERMVGLGSHQGEVRVVAQIDDESERHENEENQQQQHQQGEREKEGKGMNNPDIELLLTLGYNAYEANVLTPEVRRVVLARGTRRPRKGVPQAWTTVGAAEARTLEAGKQEKPAQDVDYVDVEAVPDLLPSSELSTTRGGTPAALQQR